MVDPRDNVPEIEVNDARNIDSRNTDARSPEALKYDHEQVQRMLTGLDDISSDLVRQL